MRQKFDHYLLKFNRILVWALAVLFIIFVICGYGIVNPQIVSELTRGILTRELSLYLHSTLDVPILILLIIHILIGLKFALLRWKVKNGLLLNGFIVVLGVFSIALLLFLDARAFSLNVW